MELYVNISHIQLLRSSYVLSMFGAIMFLITSPSYATARITLHGAELDLSASCAQIRLAVDPTLKDGIALEENDSASAAPQTTGTAPENRLSVSLPNCAKGNHVSLHLSPNTALTLHDSPHSNIIITGTLSSLESSLEDSHIEIDHVQSLDLSLKGASRAIIHQLDRAAQILENDTSSLLINHGDLSAFSAKLNGQSQLIMQQGQIETLSLVASENTLANIMAQSNVAQLITNDQAKVTIGDVKTTLTHSGNAPLQKATPAAPTPPTQPIQPAQTQNAPVTHPPLPNAPSPQTAQPTPQTLNTSKMNADNNHNTPNAPSPTTLPNNQDINTPNTPLPIIPKRHTNTANLNATSLDAAHHMTEQNTSTTPQQDPITPQPSPTNTPSAQQPTPPSITTPQTAPITQTPQDTQHSVNLPNNQNNSAITPTKPHQ